MGFEDISGVISALTETNIIDGVEGGGEVFETIPPPLPLEAPGFEAYRDPEEYLAYLMDIVERDFIRAVEISGNHSFTLYGGEEMTWRALHERNYGIIIQDIENADPSFENLNNLYQRVQDMRNAGYDNPSTYSRS